jgi:diadenosine tetraphosphate (Ap4A) HIT family hydrolase
MVVLKALNNTVMSSSPFITDTTKPLVALQSQRNGYTQLSTPTEITHYTNLPPALFAAATEWAAALETLGAQKVYWLMLSDVVPHLHLHLYPRWAEDTLQGTALFDARNNEPQPAWDCATTEALEAWATKHNVYLL